MEIYNTEELSFEEKNGITGGGDWYNIGYTAGYVTGAFFNALGEAVEIIKSI